MKNDQYKRAKISAAKYCSFGERSPKQVRDKLIKYGLAEPLVSQALEELKADNFLDEERFALAFANDKFRFNKWGKVRISMELRQHMIAEEQIEKGLRYIQSAQYNETIKDLLISKWSKLKPEEPFLSRKKKAVDYVLRKGFEAGIVFTMFDEHLSAD